MQTQTLHVLSEFGRYPMRLTWQSQTAKYLSRLESLSQDRILKPSLLITGSQTDYLGVPSWEKSYMTSLYQHVQTRITSTRRTPCSQPEALLQLRSRQTSRAGPHHTNSSIKHMPVSHTSARATTSTSDASWSNSDRDHVGSTLKQGGIKTCPD